MNTGFLRTPAGRARAGIGLLIAGLLVVIFATPLLSAKADGGGWPTPTFTQTNTPTLLPSPTFTFIPTLLPSATSVYPGPSDLFQAATLEPTPAPQSGGLLGFACWPIALLVFLAIVIGSSALIRRRS